MKMTMVIYEKLYTSTFIYTAPRHCINYSFKSKISCYT